MKSFRHKRGAKKSSQRKPEPTGRNAQIARSLSKKFQIESLETRVLLSDTSLTMLPLELPNENTAPPDAPLVLVTDQTPPPNATNTTVENPSSPASKEGKTLDVAFNSATGEMLLAS